MEAIDTLQKYVCTVVRSSELPREFWNLDFYVKYALTLNIHFSNVGKKLLSVSIWSKRYGEQAWLLIYTLNTVWNWLYALLGEFQEFILTDFA